MHVGVGGCVCGGVARQGGNSVAVELMWVQIMSMSLYNGRPRHQVVIADGIVGQRLRLRLCLWLLVGGVGSVEQRRRQAAESGGLGKPKAELDRGEVEGAQPSQILEKTVGDDVVRSDNLDSAGVAVSHRQPRDPVVVTLYRRHSWNRTGRVVTPAEVNWSSHQTASTYQSDRKHLSIRLYCMYPYTSERLHQVLPQLLNKSSLDPSQEYITPNPLSVAAGDSVGGLVV